VTPRSQRDSNEPGSQKGAREAAMSPKEASNESESQQMKQAFHEPAMSQGANN